MCRLVENEHRYANPHCAFNTPKFREWSTNSTQNRQSFAWLNVCSHHKQWSNHVSRLTCFQSKRYCLKSSKLHSEINSFETHNNAHERRKWCFCPKFHAYLRFFVSNGICIEQSQPMSIIIFSWLPKIQKISANTLNEHDFSKGSFFRCFHKFHSIMNFGLQPK